MMGIYKIMNKTNGKIYIGSAVNINQRWNKHRHCLRNNKHENSYLQRAWNFHKEINFVFEVIEECEKEKLIEKEQYWLDETKCYEESKGYNLRMKAESNMGVKMSEKHKKYLSELWSGNNARDAKLSWYLVREIREKYSSKKYTYRSLSKEYDISVGAIQKVIWNKSWVDENYIYNGLSFEMRSKINKDNVLKKRRV